MADTDTITAEYLRSIVHYDPETGEMTWKRRLDVRENWNTRWAGKRAGSRSDECYQIVINWRRYVAHRLIWLYMTGEWPNPEVDHKDGDRFNNRWSNLREATRSQQQFNVGITARNASGLKGVSFNKKAGKWLAQIVVDKKHYWLGHFDCPAAAHFAYIIAADKLHGEFARYA